MYENIILNFTVARFCWCNGPGSLKSTVKTNALTFFFPMETMSIRISVIKVNILPLLVHPKKVEPNSSSYFSLMSINSMVAPSYMIFLLAFFIYFRENSI